MFAHDDKTENTETLAQVASYPQPTTRHISMDTQCDTDEISKSSMAQVASYPQPRQPVTGLLAMAPIQRGEFSPKPQQVDSYFSYPQIQPFTTGTGSEVVWQELKNLLSLDGGTAFLAEGQTQDLG